MRIHTLSFDCSSGQCCQLNMIWKWPCTMHSTTLRALLWIKHFNLDSATILSNKHKVVFAMEISAHGKHHLHLILLPILMIP